VADQQAQFFAVTAHELRAPVSVLTGASGTLVRHFEELEPADREDLAQAVFRSSHQLRRLLEDLLTASRLQARRLDLEPESLDLPDHLESVVGGARQFVAGADVRLSAAPGLTVHADPVRLTQMIDNLVLNALRHGAPPVEISATGVGPYVEIAVRDGGAGVPEEVREQLFQRFATGSSAGTGLGLFLVRELARAHQGDAAYRPEDQAFVLTLPRQARS
jgi:signal transduction histidine kinase